MHQDNAASLTQLRIKGKQSEHQEGALLKKKKKKKEEEEEGSDVIERGKRKTEIES